MIYVTSDIHGNYVKYQNLLETIHFSPKDALIILGDVVDRGEQSMEILLDIMNRENIFMYMGNHEQIALACLRSLNQEISDESIDNFKVSHVEMIVEWLYNLGGNATLNSFKKLSKEEKENVLDFIEDLPIFDELEVAGQNYVFVHGGLKNFDNTKCLDDYSVDDILWSRMNYDEMYFEDKIIVSGHTPTKNIPGNPYPDMIYKLNNHIAIDCGCGHLGGQLGCICLNTGEEFYV